MPRQWRVAVRWVLVQMPSGRLWISADARSPAMLQQQLAQGLLHLMAGRPPIVMWEMRAAQGRVLTPAEQVTHLDVLVTIGRTLEAQGLYHSRSAGPRHRPTPGRR